MSSSSSSLNSTNTTCPNCPKIYKYGDFGRCVNDFFSKDFPTGQVKVETRTAAKNLLSVRPLVAFTDEFKVSAARDMSTGLIVTEVKSTTFFPILKTKMEGKSVTTMTSNNLLTQQFTLTNAVLDGLKLEFTGTMQPNGANTAQANVEYNQGYFLTTTTVDALRGPTMVTDLATKCRDFMIGGEVSYDVSRGLIDKYSISLGLDRAREKAVVQALTGFNTFTASYFQKFSDQLEVAYRASWSMKVPNLAMEVGAKWNMIGGGFIKAKLDNVGRLGVALASELRPGVQVVLGATVDTAKLNENAHKLGLELNYSA